MRNKIIVSLMLMLMTAACMPRMYAETGRKFDVRKFQKIKEGETTKQYITTAFGAPQQTGVKESGKEMWTYLFLSLEAPSHCICSTPSPLFTHRFMRMTITYDGDRVFEKSYEMSREKEDEKKAQ